MKKESWQQRINLIFALFFILMTILGYRLYQKQITEHSSYRAMAENQYIIKKDVQAARGQIYASDMFPLATNLREYQVMATPRNIKNKQETADKLSVLIGKDSKEIFQAINNDKYYIPALKKGLSKQDGQKIADLKLRGITMVPEITRTYPSSELASQILGFVDAEGNGHYGIEGYYNKELKGIGGEIEDSRDWRGEFFGIKNNQRPRDGSSVILTINPDIQYEAESVLKDSVEKYEADSGSVVIMDPKSGKILAMANFPTFDPNNFNKVAKEELGVFNNTTVSGAWEPGSIFKPLIMAAAIDQGKVEPETEGNFASSVVVDNYKIKTSTGQAYGRETMTQVLENSDNVAMVWLSDLLGKETMSKYIQKFGFGRKTGVELDGENPGNLADYKKWSNSQKATISFGQGITVTPLQITSAIASIANGGRLMQPYIVDQTIDPNGNKNIHEPKEVSNVISADAAKKVTGMLISVVEKGHGKKAGVPGYKVAGKTGTAQIPKPGGGYYPDRHVGSFAGFAPADDPKFVMLVRLDNPKSVEWAESSAAPAFGEIAQWLLNYMRVQPTEK